MIHVDRFNCEEVFRRLDDYVDRELSPREIELVEEHLGLCAMCAREFAFEQSLLRQVREKLARLTVPADLAQRISHALTELADEEPGDRSGGAGV